MLNRCKSYQMFHWDSDAVTLFVAVGVEDEGSRPAAFAADFGDLTFSGIVFSATC